jgi:hypothetical protein
MWTWTYNALLNVSIMDSLFHCNLPHKRQVEEWKRWDQAKYREVLEYMRTGTFGPAI